MTKECDHTSVGIIIRDSENNLALLKRARFPAGVAPVAGHIDEHGSSKQAALEEAFEELGLQLTASVLRRVIEGRRVENTCRRPGGDHHVWDVYEAEVPAGTELKPSPDETKGAGWRSRQEVDTLAARTDAYRAGLVSEEDWQADPGLEPIWRDFLAELVYVSPVATDSQEKA